MKSSNLYLQIGKQLALQLAAEYVSSKPGAAIALSVLDSITKAQAAIVAHNVVIVQAQAEGWTDTDPRWAAPLAEQKKRIDLEKARNKAMK